MTVYIINTNPSFGGARTANLAIAEMLSQLYTVIVNDEYYPREDWHYSFTLDLYPLHRRYIYRDTEEHIMSYNPDVIIWANNMMMPYYYKSILKFKKANIVQVAMFHSLSLACGVKGKLMEYFVAIASSKINKLIYVSEFTKNSWCDKYKNIGRRRNDENIVIYNPVKITKVYPARSPMGIKRVNFSFIGRLSAEKQPDIFCKLAQNDKNNSYHVWGDGPLLSSLQQNKADNLFFHGYTNDIEKIYQNTDVVMLTSKTENCPMVILEAKLRGIPVVAPNIGGISEILSEQEGALYSGYSMKDIQKAISTVLKKYELLSKASIQSVAKYSYARLISQWSQVLEK